MTCRIKWGNNVLEFTQDAYDAGIFHCRDFSVSADLLDEEPKRIFEVLLKRGSIKISEIRL